MLESYISISTLALSSLDKKKSVEKALYLFVLPDLEKFEKEIILLSIVHVYR